MKRLFSTSKHAMTIDSWLLFLRIFSGAFMITHGLPKLQLLMSGNEITFFDPIGLGSGVALGLAVFAEVICAGMIVVGLLTRPASILLIITMSVAAFMKHAEDPFSSKEKALLYLLIFSTTLFVGAGRFSVDYLISGKK